MRFAYAVAAVIAVTEVMQPMRTFQECVASEKVSAATEGIVVRAEAAVAAS